MQIKNACVVNDGFAPAVQKLLKKQMTVKQCLELSKALEELDKQKRALLRAKLALIEKFAVAEDDGNIKLEEGTMDPMFANDGDKAKCLQSIADLMNDSYELPLTAPIAISVEDTMTPMEFALLRDIIEVKE